MSGPALHSEKPGDRAKRTAIPDALLPYQQRWMADTTKLKIAEKSRRIGLTWGEAADSALLAARRSSAGGMDVFYMGYNQDMAQEFIGDCADWARAYHQAAGAIGEEVFKDFDPATNDTREIRAFRISFPSGHKVVALSSAPRSLRGMQGKVILDEAAFHDDMAGVLKAALALLIWGGRVVVISTHNGDDNPFNELINDIRAGRRPGSVHRITFDEAIEAGLYERVCLRAGIKVTAQGLAEWRRDTFAFYGEDADEELNVIPRQGGGAWLSRALIEARMRDDIPVLRWRPEPGFVDLPDEIRAAVTRDWCAEHLDPLLAALPELLSYFVGEDFARSSDLTVMWPLMQLQNLVLRTPFVVELRDVPFREQEQIFVHIGGNLPKFRAGALDARGNGSYLAERARQRFGVGRIDEVQLTAEWYRQQMPPMKAAFEDATIEIPRDADILNDLRTVVLDKGVARVPEARTKDALGGYRHGDAAIACALAIYASRMNVAPIDFQSTGEIRAAVQANDGGRPDISHGVGFGSIRGGNDFRGF